MSANSELLTFNNDLFANLYPSDEEWQDEQYIYAYDAAASVGYARNQMNPPHILIGAVVILGVLFALAVSSIKFQPAAKANDDAVEVDTSSETKPVTIPGDALTFTAPYKEYAITQGPHGMSYGHYAIDIAAGRGAEITSPINGEVTQLYVDEYGNPTLVIENEVYVVTFLHGDYVVAVGDKLKIGQLIGLESNKGYTMDMAGNLCYNREWCGNHTHLNVYDKRIFTNVNPLDLFD